MTVTGRPRSLRPDPSADFDRDADGQAEARVVNVSPYTARFEVASTPGTRARKIRLDPGETVLMQGGYTRDFTGAGRQPVRATIESLTERELYPKGPRLPMVVHEDKALEVRDQWMAALEAARTPADPVKVSIPSADGGEPVEALVRPPSIVPNPRSLDALADNMPTRTNDGMILDDEDQAGELDEPPPDHNDPLPVAVPEAPKAKRGR